MEWPVLLHEEVENRVKKRKEKKSKSQASNFTANSAGEVDAIVVQI